MRGLFITFEGVDGSGKSTQIEKTRAWLEDLGYRTHLYREPGGTALGEEIRELLLHRQGDAAPVDQAELYLFLASRAQLCETRIRPALAAGEMVICDRFTDSTLAYQGGGRGIDRDVLRALNDRATGGLHPDLTLVLDLDLQAARQRRSNREYAENRLDCEQVAFMQRVRETYLELCAEEPERLCRISGDQPGDQVFEQIRQRLSPLLKDR